MTDIWIDATGPGLYMGIPNLPKISEWRLDTDWILQQFKDVFCEDFNSGREPRFLEVPVIDGLLDILDEMVKEGYLLKKDGKYRFFL